MSVIKYTFLLLLFINSSIVVGQKGLEKYHLRKSMKQDEIQYQFYVTEEGDKRSNYKKNKKYSWYKSQKLFTTQGGASGVLLDGDFESYFFNKQLHSKGYFNRGLKDGEWRYWRNNGTLKKTEKWRNGNLIGEEVFYDENGNEEKIIHKSFNRITKVGLDTVIYLSKDAKRIFIYEDEELQKVEKYKHDSLQKTTFYQDGKKVKANSPKDKEDKKSKKDDKSSNKDKTESGLLYKLKVKREEKKSTKDNE